MFNEEFFNMYNEDKEEEEKKEESSPYDSSEPSSEYSSSPSAYVKKIFVVSVGGSILVDEKPLTTFISKFSQAINDLYGEGFRFCLVVGGGKIARNYVASAKTFGANNFALDEIGIQATKLNALMLINSLENAYPEVLTDINKVEEIISKGKIPVFGGLMPGFTTDAVAALLAEKLGADFVNLSNVEGIYSSDPEHNPRAKFYPEISYENLLSLIRLSESKPGQNVILDLPCCLILKRSKIPSIVLDGKDLENVKAALRGEDFKGTVILEESK